MNAIDLKKSFVVSAVSVEAGIVGGWVAAAFGSGDGEHCVGVPVVFFNQISKLFATAGSSVNQRILGLGRGSLHNFGA